MKAIYFLQKCEVWLVLEPTLARPMKFLAKLIGFEGSYLRFEVGATIEKLENNTVEESVTEDSAVWELMYFGNSGADK